MALTFDKIPSEIEIPLIKPSGPTVENELKIAQKLLINRNIKCTTIPVLYKKTKPKPSKFTYKFFCVCPRYAPTYPCKHAGNIIIDRDVLTKAEHLCYLAQPRENYAAPRKHPHFYHKKVILPNCTSRIVELAKPDVKRVKDNLRDYSNILSKKKTKGLKKHLEMKSETNYTTIETALSFISEERRLEKVARAIEKRRCKKVKKCIIKKQRKQIKKIICVLFEEMKDFLLNDQFLIDERSTLCSVILEQIREFTDKEFYTTSNLREYQHILANNLTVWINKFISNLNIHVSPPTRPQLEEPREPESFLPVNDYISVSDECDFEITEDDVTEEEGAEVFSTNTSLKDTSYKGSSSGKKTDSKDDYMSMENERETRTDDTLM